MGLVLAALGGAAVVVLSAAGRVPRPHNARVGEVFWMPCDDNSASSATVDDVSANNQNRPMLSGGAPEPTGLHSVAGVVGGALRFDGADDLVRLCQSGGDGGARWLEETTAAGRDFTIAFWFRLRYHAERGQCLFEVFYRSAQSFWYIDVDAGLTENRWLAARYYTPGGGQAVCTISSNPAVWSDVWHHVAFVRSGTTCSTYVNGALGASHTGAGNEAAYYVSNGDGQSKVTLGANRMGGSYADGELDDVRVYSRGLSAGEIQALHNGGAGRTTPLARP